MQDAVKKFEDQDGMAVVLGLLCALIFHWACFPVAMVIAAIPRLRRNDVMAAVQIGLAAVILLFGMGYSLGKQAAIRDNQLGAATTQQH